MYLYPAVPEKKDPRDIAPMNLFQLYIQSMNLNDMPNDRHRQRMIIVLFVLYYN